MEDRKCTHLDVKDTFQHCGQIYCFLCYNYHMKYQHDAKYTYEPVNGNMTETKYPFVPPPDVPEPKPGFIDPLVDELSDEQVAELEASLRLKMNKAKPKFVPSSPQNLTSEEWTAHAQESGESEAGREAGARLRALQGGE